MIFDNNLFKRIHQLIFEAKIKYSNKDYKLIQSYHLKIQRGKNNNTPRGAILNNVKYELLMGLIPNNIQDNEKFAIIWTNNNTANGIVAIIENNKITIITAILRRPIKELNKIFKSINLRYDIGEQNI